MVGPEREIYASENGDRWSLLTDAGGRAVVRHTGNAASGGHVTATSLPAFLERDRGSPEHRALWQLIAGLVEAGTAAAGEQGRPRDAGEAHDRRSSSEADAP